MDQRVEGGKTPGILRSRLRPDPAGWMIFRNSNFGRIWISQLQSNLGTWLTVIAVPVFVYHLTGSPLGTSIAFVAEALPALIFAPFAGVLVDRWNRRLVMVGSDAARALCVLCMLFALNGKLVWVIYVAIFAENSLAQFFDPAYSAIIPTIVGRGRNLDEANAWSSASVGVVRLAGGPLGGVLYSLLGFHALVIVDSITYLVSASLVLSLTVSPKAKRAAESTPNGPAQSLRARGTGFLAELREGVGFLSGNAVLRSLLIVSSIFLFANGALNIIVIPFVVHVLHRGAQEVGILFTALGLGYIFGSFLGRFFSRRNYLRAGTLICMTAVTAAFAGMFNSDQIVYALIFITLVGVPAGAFLLLIRVQIQRNTQDRILGRISSAFSAFQMATTVAGAALGGIIAKTIGIVPMADVALVPLVVAIIVACVAVPRQGLTAEKAHAAPAPGATGGPVRQNCGR